MRRQLLEAVLQHLLVAGALQHRRHQRHPEALPHPVDAGENLLRVHGHIDQFAFIRAVAADSAQVVLIIFAEIGKLRAAQAAGRIAVINHLLQLAVFIGLALSVLRVLLDQEFLGHNILRAEQQDTLTRLPVPAGAPGLLDISLHILRHVVVNNIAHVGFVDPHPERIGRNHNPDVIIQEAFLAVRPLLVAHSGMIAACSNPRSLQTLVKIIHLFTGRSIHNTRLV
ncbi:hypothetical protein D3C75_266080 [compost metagenome]